MARKTNFVIPKEKLLDCCACHNWVNQVFAKSPFFSFKELCQEAEKIWFALAEKDWLEAFSSHPRIGQDQAQKQGSPNHQKWSKEEQQKVQNTDANTSEELAKKNQEYFEKFGFIFIVCASGKGALEMLGLLKKRIKSSYEQELQNAAKEQNKINLIRLKKIL